MTDPARTQSTVIDAVIARRRRTLVAALAVTALTSVVTGLAHAIGGGAAPDVLLLATASVVTLLVLTPVLRGRPSSARRVVAVVLAQLVQHSLYALPDLAGPAPAAGAHTHDDGGALATATLHEHASMPIAHVIAGAVTLAVLRWVPRVVDAMLDAMSLRRAVTALTWTPTTPRHRARVVAPHRPRRTALDGLGSACGTRGPPALLV